MRIPEQVREIARYPSALGGLLIILMLIVISLSTIISIPYSEAIRLWRGGEGIWLKNPRNAWPEWVNFFPRVNLPKTTLLSSEEKPVLKKVNPLSEGLYGVEILFEFDYEYAGFPQEITLFLEGEYRVRRPHISLFWFTPDGREIHLTDRSVGASDAYRLSQDDRLQRKLGGISPQVGLFIDSGLEENRGPLPGRYRLTLEGLLFEDDSDLKAELIVYGQVHGPAGTDHRRRDLSVALLWGMPLALAFGFLAAVGSTLTTMVIAAVGVWFGGWVDALIQRITEVNLILPVLPLLIMIGTLYSRSIWVMLTVVIILGIFSAGIKTYRAIFLQVKESPYIEAARAYGASNLRIISHYMIPRVIPVLVPQFIVLIPSFVFLEATLALLGLGDPVLPTWGKVLNDAFHNGALYQGYYYWVLQPSFLLMITGLGFAMLGFALDRIFNPRLRGL